jgi:excisionase family DNA binding protein
MEIKLEKESYSTRELMLLLNLSHMAIYKLVKNGRLHPVRIGNKHVFFKEDVERYIREEQNKRAMK